jgi:hypothetical protein
MVILTLWGIFLSCCVYLYAHFGTEAQRAEYVTRKIEESLDIPMNLADIVVGITPYPHALLRDISLHGAWGSFDAKEIKLEMSWASLGKYEFMPGKITVTGPSVKLDIDKLLEQAASAGDVRMESAPPVFPYMDRIDLPGVLADLSIDIQDGYFDLTRKEEKVLLSGVDGQIKLPGLFAGSADFKMKDVKIFRADQYVFNVGDLYLNAARIRLPGDRQILRGTFSLTGKCAAAGIFDSLDTSLVIRAGGGSGRTGGGSGRAGDSSRRTGDSSNRAGGSSRRGGGSSREPALFATIALSWLVVDGEAIDGRMNLPLLFEAPDRKRTVGRIENAILEMDKDRIRLDGVLDFSDTPTLDGILGIERFSLTRWFGFTRAFPPGLQVLLSDLSGEMDFSVNEHGLKVPRLEAVVKQRPYAGTASVEDFSKPDLRIALKTEYADLDHVLPELTQEGFSAPHWPRALVEAGGEGKGIDFDISIDADGGKFMFADCGKLNFRVVSANKEDYAVFAAEKIYGGSINARADFMGESMKLQAGISRMNAEPLSRAVLPQNPVGGQIDAVAGISFRTGGFASFAASLAGALDCTVRDGYFTAKSGRQDFSKLEFSFKGAGTGAHEDTLLPENFVYTGDWKLSLQAADWRAGINAKGPVRFNTNFMPVLISDLPGRVQGNHMGVDLDATASFSYDAGRDRLDVKKIQGTISGGKVSGSFGGAPLGGNTVWQGQLDVGSTTLRATLKGLNLLPEDLPPSAFRSMKANSQFTISDAQWRLEKLSGRIDQTTLSGSIIRNAATVPLWNVDLALGDIDSARYLSSKSKEGPANPWPTQLLREQNISGQISIASVLFKGLKFERLRLPVELKMEY